MSDRSVRVQLSGDVSNYVVAVNKAASATREIAVAAAEVRTKLHALSSNNGLDALARDLGKVNVALRGMSGARDIALVANAVRTLSGGRGLTTSVDDIRRFASAIRSIPTASAATMREVGTALHGLGSISASAPEALTRMASGIRGLVRTANSVPALRALAAAIRDLGVAGGVLGNVANVGNSLRGMQGQIDQLRRSIAGLRGAAGGGSGGSGSSGGIFGSIFGGAALGSLASNVAMQAFSKIASGLKDTAKATADYETQIQTFGAVTKATNQQLKDASALAIKLGGDVTIAGANAGDAAGVLTELAKGGLSVANSFKAAKGSLQLASAASVDMGTAAGIQTAALNSFNLGADQAGKVADILANTAAAASGEITDFAEGMKQSGAVAHNFGMSLLENQTILAQFAQAGIKGSMGGNILKSALLSVEKASGPSGKALKQMGVEVKNSNGTYITAAQLEDQLAAAKKRMGTTSFNTAAAIAFGTRGVIFANVAANEGAKGFNELSKKINDGAGAAAFSQAKMSGLGGAMKNVQNQFETAQVVIGEKFSGALQTALKGVAAAIPILTGFLTGGSIGSGLSGIGKWFTPLIDGAKALITTAAPYVSSFIGSLGRGFGSVMTFVKPVADGIGAFFKNLTSSGTVSAAGKALVAVGQGFEGVLKFLAPVGSVIGDVVGWFGKIPTPIYAGVAALTAFILLKGPLTAMLFKAAWNIGLLRMSITNLFSAGIMNGFKTLGRGLLGALGGPVGLAITGVTIGLGYLFSAMGNGKQAGEDLKAEIDAITASLNQNTGAITDNTSATIADNLQKNGAATAAKNLGIDLADLVPAALNASGGMARLNADVSASIGKSVAASAEYKSMKGDLDAAGISAADLTKAVQTNDFGPVQAKWAAYGDTLSNNVDATLRLNHEQDALNTIISGAPALMAPYADLLGKVGGQTDEVSKGQQTVADKIALTTKAAKDYASGGVSGMELANEAVMISATKMGAYYDGIATAIDGAKLKLSDFYTVVAGKTDKDPSTIVTPMTVAFDKYNTAVSAADTTTQLFIFTMDKLAGRNVPVEEAMSANAAAARGLGAAQRSATQNLIDQRKAVADLAAAKANLGKQELVDTKNADGTVQTNRDGSHVQHYATASDATTADDIAAAQLRLAAANDAVAGSQDGINQANTEYQKTAALRVTQIATTAARTGGFAGAVKSATAEMEKQRKAFIAQQPAADIASGAAGKLADKYGLIPKNVTTILKGDPALAVLAAKEAQHAAELTAIRKYELQLTADAFPAVTDAKNLSKLADAATALRKLKIDGEDNASPKVQALLTQIADLQTAAKKPITLSVNAAGGVMKINPDGSFSSGPGTMPGAATGGHITGPGTGTSDSIPVRLSNGEFVVKADQTAKHLPLLHAINSGAEGFATGGLVGTTVGPAKITMNETGNINPAIAQINSIFETARKSAAALNAIAGVGNAVGAGAARAAETQLGVPYVYAAESPGIAFDCSGLTKWAYGQVGVPLAHYSGAQAVGQQVTQAALQPGDLSVWDGHVNMYVGGGNIIEAPEPGKTVRERPVYTSNQGDPFLGFWRPAVLSKNYSPATASPADTAKDTPGASAGSGQRIAGINAAVQADVPLMEQVFRAKGFPTSQVYIMANQEQHESSGNQYAQNNTDSNARAGHPTGGILQFRDDTFAANADPGFTSFWDKASQMHAFLNYVPRTYGSLGEFAKRNYGAYADGGLIRGPGTGRSDSIPARVSNGEFIVNAKSTAANLPLLSAINGYANGGLVGSIKGLSGGVVSTAGAELSNVVQALQDIAQAVRDARDAVAGKRDTERTKYDSLLSARATAAANIAAAEGRLKAAQKAATGSAASQGAAAAAQLAGRANSSAAAVASAQKRLADAQAAPHTGQWGKAITTAENALKKAQASSASAQAALDARVHAVTASKAASAAAKIEAAQLQLTKVQSLAKVSVGNAERNYSAARKTANAYAASAAAAEKYQASMQRQYRAQQVRAAQVDSLTARLSTANDKLASMRSDKASMASGIASTVSGFDGGITGHSDTRTSFATILKGQQYDLAQAQKFNLNVTKLRALGLNNTSLNAIASAGVDGGGVAAAGLAGASKAQIAQLNATTGKITAVGNNVGSVVASQFYDAGIRAGQGLVDGLKSQIGAIQKVMDSVAASVVATLTSKLQIHSPSRVMHALGAHTAAGYTNGILSGYGAVGSAVNGMVQVPNIPSQSFGRAGSSSPQITLHISGSDNLSAAVASMISVEFDGHLVDVGHAFEKAGMQS